MDAEILFFFNEHMDALPLYQRLEALILEQIPDVRIKVSKTQIGFFNKRGFAFVSFNPCRRAKDRPETWMTVTFGLAFRVDGGYRALSQPLDPSCDGVPGRGHGRAAAGLDPGGGSLFRKQAVRRRRRYKRDSTLNGRSLLLRGACFRFSLRAVLLCGDQNGWPVKAVYAFCGTV